MLSFLLLSCIKPVALQPSPIASETEVSVMLEFTDALVSTPLEESSLFSTLPKIELGQYRYLSKTQATPQTSQVNIPPPAQGPPTNVYPTETIPIGDSIWWYFSSEIDPSSLTDTIDGWAWSWHSPTLLELRPISPLDSVFVPTLNLTDTTGSAISLPEQHWRIEKPILSKAIHLPDLKRLQVCFKSQISRHHAQDILRVVRTGSEAQHEPLLLPFNESAATQCGTNPSIGIRWTNGAQALLNIETAQTWFTDASPPKELSLICADEPCLPDSELHIFTANLTDSKPKLGTRPNWEEQEIQQTEFGWKIIGKKPIGKNIIEISIGDKSLKTTHLIQAPHPTITLPKKTISPDKGLIVIPAEGEWTISVHPTQHSEWVQYLSHDSYTPQEKAIETHQQSAVGNISFAVPDSNQNYIARFRSHDIDRTLWITPEDIQLSILSGRSYAIMLLGNSDGPIKNAVFKHPSGAQNSNLSGEIRIQSNKLTPQSWIEWKNIWLPIIPPPPKAVSKSAEPWPIFLSQNTLRPTEVLKVYGWTPEANVATSWSISSDERLDIITGEKLSGSHAELEFHIPIPRHFPSSNYQLRITQNEQHAIEYFSVQASPQKPLIVHEVQNDSILLKLKSEPAVQKPTYWFVEAETTDGWKPVGFYWVPSSAQLKLTPLNSKWKKIRINIVDPNGESTLKQELYLSDKPEWHILGVPDIAQQFQPLSLQLNGPISTGLASKKWSVMHDQKKLCDASLDEPCTFQPTTSGQLKMSAWFHDTPQTPAVEFEMLVVGTQAVDAWIVKDESNIYVQARSNEARLQIYTVESEDWHVQEHHISNGHLILPIPIAKKAHFFLWDEFGLFKQQLNFEPNETIHLRQVDDDIVLNGSILENGAILLNTTSSPTPTALGPVKFPKNGDVRWTNIKNDAKPIRIQATTPSVKTEPVLFEPPPSFRPQLYAPKILRLGETSQAELQLNNPSSEALAIQYRLIGPAELGFSNAQISEVSLPAKSIFTVPIKMTSKGYGTHNITLEINANDAFQVLKAAIKVPLSSADSVRETEYYVDIKNQGRFTEHTLPVTQRPISLSTNIQPTLELTQVARAYAQLPPTPKNKTQQIWVANALWDQLSHGLNPSRVSLLDIAADSLLTSEQPSAITDQILWNAGLMLSLHNGVTPAMSAIFKSFERMPYEIPLTLPTSVQQTLQSLQYWTIAMAQTSTYRGLAPALDKSWFQLVEKNEWHNYPTIAQSILLCTAAELDNKTLRNAILNDWAKDIDRLNAPIPTELATHFNWPTTAGASSVRWAISKVAPKSPISQQLKPSDALAPLDLWELLARSAEISVAKANLQPSLLSEQRLVQSGRYHPYRTIPIHHQSVISKPTKWQMLLFGTGRQYYTIAEFQETEHTEKIIKALLEVNIRPIDTVESCQNECMLSQHKLYQLELTAQGLERGKRYMLYWPDFGGFNSLSLQSLGGEIVSHSNEWVLFKATDSKMSIHQMMEARFAGEYRILPFQIFDYSQPDLLASTPSKVWTIKSTSDGHPTQPLVE